MSTSQPSAGRIATLRAEIAATEAKLERLRAALAIRKNALNRLLASDALNGTDATARLHRE